ncbi:DUF4091 domain-containing protein [Victivallis sp. Marseille-Q1083]|uniref:DUF4091 domain-containing protein n=1 Tax=Victivallis sp. Marseille-Q1083 TaxID=2717288 RepID=UPI0015885AEB|nr:DUF4091 domain-containing protein [Victivallis sp. Marseille-Q1083]
MFKFRLISSLEKVFCDEALQAEELCCGTALQGEIYSFQVAYWTDSWCLKVLPVVESPLAEAVTVREVKSVPSELPANDPEIPDAVLRRTPGLYPDLLDEIADGVKTLPEQWRTLWVSVAVPENCAGGKYPIRLKLVPAEPMPDLPEVLGEGNFTLEVVPVALPEQTLIHTEWFHADCLYTYYQVPCWSERHWELLKAYIQSAADHGINMLLTPLWTQPLDTAVGGERPTVQLLKISKKGDRYHFDFSLLERWIDLCESCGIRYFEMSHLYTQWGATCTPKIVVEVDGEEQKLFGWQVSAQSVEYRQFLQQLLPELTAFLRGKQLEGRCYFHVSDEPSEEHLESYQRSAEFVASLLDGDWPMIDALSSFEFYAKGLVKLPIPSNDHIEAFVEHQVQPLWTYYCVGQRAAVPNRFYSFSSARNRIMGILMYRYQIKGFLQWGFNFWYTQYSLKQDIDPFRETDAGRAFCGGDSYLVYPGKNGPLDSIRYEVFRDGLQDMRALELLEKKIGRPAVLELLEGDLGYQLTMKRYPRSASWLLEVRNRINRALA